MDLARIKELIQLVEQSDVNGLVLVEGNSNIEIKKNIDVAQSGVIAPAAVAAIAVATAKEPVKEPAKSTAHLTPIKSPMSGTFYVAPSPDEPPFVAVGETISKGKTVCVIEAMKTFNQIESEVAELSKK